MVDWYDRMNETDATNERFSHVGWAPSNCVFFSSFFYRGGDRKLYSMDIFCCCWANVRFLWDDASWVGGFFGGRSECENVLFCWEDSQIYYAVLMWLYIFHHIFLSTLFIRRSLNLVVVSMRASEDCFPYCAEAIRVVVLSVISIKWEKFPSNIHFPIPN